MALTVVLGGARSGKSALAVRTATAQARPVAFIATAEPGDEEMAARIAAHRAERPFGWRTVEAPVDLDGALRDCPPGAFVIVDCLTLWVSNLVGQGRDGGVVAEAVRAAATAAGRAGPTVVVSNEVGSGIVPADAGTRRYRDLLGEVNAAFVAAAGRAVLMVAGRALPLSPAEGLVDG
ncbi:MAG: bifunctional adenosylcobinamide kinase/adenosylcobinamide-phosphate guanylyltransferase [Acidimicrobiales bacterium]